MTKQDLSWNENPSMQFTVHPGQASEMGGETFWEGFPRSQPRAGDEMLPCFSDPAFGAAAASWVQAEDEATAKAAADRRILANVIKLLNQWAEKSVLSWGLQSWKIICFVLFFFEGNTNTGDK